MVFLSVLNQVRENISKIIEDKGYDKVTFVVDPSKSGFGDIACNVAFLLAKSLKKSPQEIAQVFVDAYDVNLDNELDKLEVQSGYINFFLDIRQFSKAVY